MPLSHAHPRPPGCACNTVSCMGPGRYRCSPSLRMPNFIVCSRAFIHGQLCCDKFSPYPRQPSRGIKPYVTKGTHLAQPKLYRDMEFSIFLSRDMKYLIATGKSYLRLTPYRDIKRSVMTGTHPAKPKLCHDIEFFVSKEKSWPSQTLLQNEIPCRDRKILP